MVMREAGAFVKGVMRGLAMIEKVRTVERVVKKVERMIDSVEKVVKKIEKRLELVRRVVKGLEN